MTDSTELAPTNLVALRDGKQRAEALIAARFAEGLIDQDELERRLERVQDAQTMATLERLIVDLVDPGTSPSAALLLGASGPRVTALARVEDVPAQRKIIAVFGARAERGRWTPARHNRVVDVFAEAVLDLREAILAPGATVFELRCVAGSVELIVPVGLAVRVEANVVLGEIDRDRTVPSEPAAPGDPFVVVTGYLIMAELEIEARLPGERGKDAKRRRKRERKQRERERREALPEGGRR